MPGQMGHAEVVGGAPYGATTDGGWPGRTPAERGRTRRSTLPGAPRGRSRDQRSSAEFCYRTSRCVEASRCRQRALLADRVLYHRRRGDDRRQACRACRGCAARWFAECDEPPRLAANFGFERQPMIVHRLDRDTSGCLLLRAQSACAEEARRGVRGGNRRPRPISRSSTVYLRCRRGRSTWRSARSARSESGWRMLPDPKGQHAVTHWEVVSVRRWPRACAVPTRDRSHASVARSCGKWNRHARSQAIRFTAPRGRTCFSMHTEPVGAA